MYGDVSAAAPAEGRLCVDVTTSGHDDRPLGADRQRTPDGAAVDGLTASGQLDFGWWAASLFGS